MLRFNFLEKELTEYLLRLARMQHFVLEIGESVFSKSLLPLDMFPESLL